MSTWIKTTDQLPPASPRLLLVLTNEPCYQLAFRQTNSWGIVGVGLAPLDEVSHWMPLPEPPSE